MALTIDDIKLHMVPHEGNVSHMYLDTASRVTVGIGNMLPSVTAAQALAFIDRTTKNAATQEQIKTDFEAVAKQPPALPARRYREHTKLDLPDVAVNLLFKDRVAEFTRQLTSYFPDHSTFPDPAQLAILDMAFNLGAAALNTKWPSLKRAILAQDWAEAEKHCSRPQAQPSRNYRPRRSCSESRRTATKAEDKSKPRRETTSALPRQVRLVGMARSSTRCSGPEPAFPDVLLRCRAQSSCVRLPSSSPVAIELDSCPSHFVFPDLQRIVRSVLRRARAAVVAASVFFVLCRGRTRFELVGKMARRRAPLAVARAGRAPRGALSSRHPRRAEHSPALAT